MDRVFVSWNVAGLSEEQLDERTEAQCLLLLLSDPTPWVIGLQEVVRRTWYAHWRPHLAAAGFRVFPEDPTATDSEYFSLLAVRDPAATSLVAPFAPSRMGRRLVGLESAGWSFLTAHLESERAGSDLRIAQARAITRFLAGSAGPAVFAGDTNLRIEEEGAIEGLAQVDDAWVRTGSPAAARTTWRGGKASARFDRVWCNRVAHPAAFDLLPGAGSVSDHQPVRVRLQRAD